MTENVLASSSRSIPTRRIRKVKECPQLEIFETPLTSEGNCLHCEYRVYNWRVLPSARIVRGDGTSFLELLLLVVLAYWLWQGRQHGFTNLRWSRLDLEQWRQDWKRSLAGLTMLTLLWSKCRTVLHESIIPLSQIGLQISTTRGVSLPHPLILLGSKPVGSRLLLPIFTSRRFIPLDSISTIIINERLTRWSVRYYLAVVLRNGEGVVVLLENMRQDLAVMKEIYHGTREILFDDFDDFDHEHEEPAALSAAGHGDSIGIETTLRRKRSKKRRK